MEWSKVQHFLTESLVTSDAQRERIVNWISRLQETNFGWQLALCMAIDVASGAIKPKLFGSLIENIDPNTENPVIGFSQALAKYPGRQDLLCSARKGVTALPRTDSYLHVFTLTEFIDYYAGPTYGYLSFDPIDRQKVQGMYFADDESSNLADLARWWEGSLPVVWVTSWLETRNLINANADGAGGTVVNDALGLARPEGEDLVAVHYPPGFDRIVPCARPTTLDLTWSRAPHFFLSSGGDGGWGQTQPCSGADYHLRERIHGHLKGLTEEYHGVKLGKIQHTSQRYELVIAEGYSRLCNLIDD